MYQHKLLKKSLAEKYWVKNARTHLKFVAVVVPH